MKKQLLLLITFISTSASHAQYSLTEKLSATSSKISAARKNVKAGNFSANRPGCDSGGTGASDGTSGNGCGGRSPQ